ncbi:MAG TPA: TIGR01212 family radical SAM protein [Fibrobacteria bacterium]|nr:TIGR01212 family radical SAM protein [Fibrobacteria bacterium]
MRAEGAQTPGSRTLAELVRTLGTELRERYCERVHKLALDTGFTCPNRDGSLGHGGCTFCNNESFAPSAKARPDVLEQMSRGAAVVAKRTGARRYLAYFQAYTNTYDRLDRLDSLYRQSLSFPGCVGLSIGTRPDCLGEGVLELLARIRDEGHLVWLELGLQTVFDHTLERVNRGHGSDVYFEASRRARALGLPVCCHLILGLPGEDRGHALESHRMVVDAGVDGLKIHPLHVVRSSLLAAQWRAGDYAPMSLSDYAEWTADLIERTPPDIVFHRLTGTCSEDLLLAPAWCAKKWDVLNRIESVLRRRGTRQGSALRLRSGTDPE